MVAGSLDTNVLLRFLVGDVPNQMNAIVALLEKSQGPFVVADTAIVELIFGLDRYYGFQRTKIAQTVGRLLSVDTFSCNRTLINAALADFVAHRTLSFEDCYLAATAELADATPLWTFDRKLATKLPAAKLVPKA